MGRLVIAFDCDDVLLPAASAIINNYNDRFGTRLELRHFYNHDDLRPWGVDTYDEAIGRVFEFLRSDEHTRIIPTPDTVKAISRLAKIHELHVVTGRPSFLQTATKAAIDTYFPNCFKSIEHTNYITLSTDTETKRTKSEVCRLLGVDVLIDDHVAHAEDAISAGVGAIVFGSYPWNLQPLPCGVVRCEDWDDVEREVARCAVR